METHPGGEAEAGEAGAAWADDADEPVWVKSAETCWYAAVHLDDVPEAVAWVVCGACALRLAQLLLFRWPRVSSGAAATWLGWLGWQGLFVPGSTALEDARQDVASAMQATGRFARELVQLVAAWTQVFLPFGCSAWAALRRLPLRQRILLALAALAGYAVLEAYRMFRENLHTVRKVFFHASFLVGGPALWYFSGLLPPSWLQWCLRHTVTTVPAACSFLVLARGARSSASETPPSTPPMRRTLSTLSSPPVTNVELQKLWLCYWACWPLVKLLVTCVGEIPALAPQADQERLRAELQRAALTFLAWLQLWQGSRLLQNTVRCVLCRINLLELFVGCLGSPARQALEAMNAGLSSATGPLWRHGSTALGLLGRGTVQLAAAAAAAAGTSVDGLLGLGGQPGFGGAAVATGLDVTQPSFALALAQAGTTVEPPKPMVTCPSAFTTPAIQSGPTKLFVGSVPSGTTQQALHDEFAKYGPVAEIFLKHDATEAGRMWGFVTFVSPDGAAAAVAALNEQFVFPGATRPLAVSFARSSMNNSQGDSGNTALSSLAAVAASNPTIAPVAASVMGGPTKLFIGSVPGGTTRGALEAEFAKFGMVMDVFLKNDRDEPSRMWGFVTYQDAASAAAAVAALHERLVLPGGSRPCAVSFARNSQAQHSMAAQAVVNPMHGQTKLFIGTIPVGTTEAMLRKEFERFGQVTEIFLKHDIANEGRMWGFLSYADPQSAAIAVSSLHEKLMLPGSVRPCAVSFARSSGKGAGKGVSNAGFDALGGVGLGGGLGQAQPALADMSVGQPPPVVSEEWKVYYTAQGLPYYHNANKGVTQWECPPELGGAPAGVAGLLAAQGTANALGLLGGDAAAVPEVQVAAQPGIYAAPESTFGVAPTMAVGTTMGVDGQPLRYSPY
mmetsp:Transcript_27737/g.88164  ORF Transcript_27737/g.88164 Transcript_27737/m.88164 type:complete len:902 (+) Transcript_27737:50-2755(+)